MWSVIQSNFIKNLLCIIGFAQSYCSGYVFRSTAFCLANNTTNISWYDSACRMRPLSRIMKMIVLHHQPITTTGHQLNAFPAAIALWVAINHFQHMFFWSFETIYVGIGDSFLSFWIGIEI